MTGKSIVKTPITAKKVPYFHKRLEAVGIDPDRIPGFKVVSPGLFGEKPTESYRDYFAPGKNGSIIIRYPELLDDRQQKYTTDAKRWATHNFERTRFHPDIPRTNKYGQPKGSGVHVFYTPLVLELAREGKEIRDLVLVEGEFKAWSLFHYYNIPAIGLSGITGYKEKGESIPHPDLRSLFKVCKVQNLILMHDADATLPDFDKWKLDPEYDLGRKPYNFFMSVIGFYETMDDFVNEIYYTRVNEECIAQYGAKGIDDLIETQYENQEPFEAIVSELTTHQETGMFLSTHNLSRDGRGSKIRGKLFCIPVGRNNPPNAFYAKYARVLDNSEFTFLRGKYSFDVDRGELTMQKHPEADMFLRIGCYYFKMIYRTKLKNNANVNYDIKLEPWAVSVIKQDYIVEKGYKSFLEWIPKYDAAINFPENDPRKYRQSITVKGEADRTSVCYNLYHRITHVPTPGSWETIEGYLKHLFAVEEQLTAIEDDGAYKKGEPFTVSRYEMALDYLQLLYQNPTQKLPIVALVSEEQHTGKSTFLNLLCDIFQENATKIGNTEITDRFNDDYATKLLICLDEGLIEKKATVEKLKAWSTDDKISIDTKNVSRQRVDFYGKIVICSNRERNFLPIDQNDSRFWITKVHPFQGAEQPHIREKMAVEIPAFIEYLSKREMHHAEITRHWFSYNLFESTAKDKLKSGSKEWIHSEFEAWIKEQFLDVYQWHELYFSILEIEKYLNESSSGVRFRKAALKDLLQYTYGLEAVNSSYQMPLKVINGVREEGLSETTTIKGRKYIFSAKQFLTDREMEQLSTKPPTAAVPSQPPTPESQTTFDDDELENGKDPLDGDFPK